MRTRSTPSCPLWERRCYAEHVDATQLEARAAKRKLAARLREDANVNGIGITRADGGFALKVNLVASGSDIPSEIDGVPIRVEVVGPIKTRDGRAAGH